ncbi:MAG: PAS domain S-box protein [Alphaproteobacteria bacterium]|nr:PAS domain S-box protein [Alphaproteobacteria bacterium]
MTVPAGRSSVAERAVAETASVDLLRLLAHTFGASLVVRPLRDARGNVIDGRIEAINSEALRLTRVPLGDPTGKSLVELYEPDGLRALLAALAQARPGGDPVDLIWSLRSTLSVHARAINVSGGLIALSLRDAGNAFIDAIGSRQLLDHAPFSIVIKTPDSRYLYANKEFEKQVGRPADEILGKTSLEVLPPGVAERFAARDQMVVTTRSPVAVESEELLLGRTHTFINRAYPLFDASGAVSAIVSTETDITALRQAEQKVSESERLFRAVFETAGVGIAMYGAKDRRLISCNPTYARILGYKPDELTGRSFLDLTHSDDRKQQVELASQQELGAIGGFELEKRYLRKDGGIVWGRISVSMVRDEKGDPLCTVGILTDLTDRHAAEERLQQSEHQLRLITDSVPVLITYCDAEGRYRFINREYEEWSGKSRPEVIGKTVRENLGEANFAKVKPFIDAVLTGCPQHFETEIQFPKVGKRAVSCSYVPHLDEAGGVIGYFVVVSDISTRMEQERLLRKAKEEAEEISRAKSSFLATMSHELRTPLNAIIGFSEMIRDQVLGPIGTDRYKDYASDIHLSGEHLLDLINSILDLARIEAGRFEIDRVPTDLCAVARVAIPIMRGHATAGGLDFVIELPDRPALVIGDPVRLRQVMINLLSNAIKFTPPKGMVRLTIAHRTGSRIEFSVSDTGIGMREDEIPKALELFGQIDNRMTRRYQGAGIGLPFTKALVEAQGGTFSIVSAPERGTTVTALFSELNESLTGGEFLR